MSTRRPISRPLANPSSSSSSSSSSSNQHDDDDQSKTIVPRSQMMTPRLAVMLIVVGAIVLYSQYLSLSSRSSSSSSSSSLAALSTPSGPVWGTYRPNLYLGVRATSPASPLFGWAWSCAPSASASFSRPSTCGPEQQVTSLRHDAEERDGLAQYGWTQHDGRGFGVQSIVDTKMGVNFTTTFVQPIGTAERWAVRIDTQTTEGGGKGKAKDRVALYFYIALTDADQSMDIVRAIDDAADSSSTSADGSTHHRIYGGPTIGDLTVRSGVASSSSSSSRIESSYFGVSMDLSETPPPPGQAPQHTWSAKDNIQRVLTDEYRAYHSAAVAESGALESAHNAKYKSVKHKRKFVYEQPTWFARLPNTIAHGSNFVVVQHVLELPFSIDYVMQSTATYDASIATQNDARAARSDVDSSDTHHHVSEVGATEQWFGMSLSSAISQRSAAFQSEFAKKFPMSSGADKASRVGFAQSLLSNLVGGIGYFHGRQIVEDAPARAQSRSRAAIAARTHESEPSSLLTAVPSRSFFPRGFMWDEGFHQLLISQWDLSLSLSILASWFSQIQANSEPRGWLPREQILGSEARARVPAEFRAQKPTVANPPTLILALERILLRVEGNERREIVERGAVTDETREQGRKLKEFIQEWLPKIHMHVQWFITTQASVDGKVDSIGHIDLYSSSSSPSSPPSPALPISFRWAGRTLTHCLASGLDDYPRALFLPSSRDRPSPSPSANPESKIGLEGHVDMHAWMIVLTKTMAGLTQYMHRHGGGAEKDGANRYEKTIHYDVVSKAYSSYAEQLSHTLIDLHWNLSPSASSNTDGTSSRSGNFADYAYRNGTRQFISHVGYVSFLPFFLCVLPPSSPQVLILLRLLRSPSGGVWTSHGIRSLSSHDAQYGAGEDYWRGHVWINMQYLAYDALMYYASHASSGASVAALALSTARELRTNVVGNVHREYVRTGFAWEQYHAKDGRGRKSHPFTGWTALTMLMMKEEK